MNYQNKKITASDVVPQNAVRIVDGIRHPAKRVEVLSRSINRNVTPQRTVFNSGLRMTGVVTLAALLMIGLSSVGSTVSYFNDKEVSSGNRLQAGTVVFDISSENDAIRRVTLQYFEESVGTEEFVINVDKSDTSLPLVYNVEGTLDESNPEGCEMVAVDATFEDYHYNGLLKDFISPNQSNMGEWRFIIALPVYDSPLAPDAECNGKILFHAGLAGVADDLIRTFQDHKEYDFKLYNWDYSLSTPETLIEEPAPDYLIPEDTGPTEMPSSTSSLQSVESGSMIVKPEEEKVIDSSPDSPGATTLPQDIVIPEPLDASLETVPEIPPETPIVDGV